MLTSAKFQTLCVTERHEALNALTRDQLIEFTEGFTPSAGLPVGAESCWRTLALRLAIELREERAKHYRPDEPFGCDCEPGVTPCPRCDRDVMTRELEGMPAADVAMARAAGGSRL